MAEPRLRSTTQLSASWLSDEMDLGEQIAEDGLGIIPCFALLANKRMMSRLHSALKAGGVDSEEKNSWGGTFLIESTRAPEACIMALFPSEPTFEGAMALYKLALTSGKLDQKDRSSQLGRIRFIDPA